MLSAYLRAYNSYEQVAIISPSRTIGFGRLWATFVCKLHFAVFRSPQRAEKQLAAVGLKVWRLVRRPVRQRRPRPRQSPRTGRTSPSAASPGRGSTDPVQPSLRAAEPDTPADRIPAVAPSLDQA